MGCAVGLQNWNIAYRFSGKQLKLSLGAYPAVGLKDAREQRDAAKRILAAGFDPGQHKKTAALAKANTEANTFAVIADELLAKKMCEGLVPATLQKVQWLLDFARPALGARPIAAITAPEILVVLRGVEGRGRHETAKRLRSTIGECFRYAAASGRAETDPTSALKGALTAPQVRHRAALTGPKAFGGLLRAISAYDGSPEVRAALQLLALTFVRPGELRAAEWSEFDLENAEWAIPPARMKMRRPHRVPLAPQTIAILIELHAITGRGKFLFPSVRSASRCISENTIYAALRRMGFTKEEMSGHGFRAVASTILNESGKWQADSMPSSLTPGSRETFAFSEPPSRPAAIEDKIAAPVSVVMTTFNGEKYIADQLESLGAQTLRPAELIVSDDGSTDDTLSTVRAFSQRAPFPVQIRQNPERLGYGENFLTATRQAIGKYIAFCDQDDVWRPQKLARCVAALQTEKALLCAHAAHLIDETSNPIGFFSQGIQTSKVYLPLTLPPWGVFLGFSNVFETSLLHLIDARWRGLDNHTKEGLLAHDRWVYFLASSFGKTVVLAEPLASYRQHGANLFGGKSAPPFSVIKSKLSLSQRDLLDHRAMASHRAKILSSAAERLWDATLARQAELSSRRWQALAKIYELRASLHGSPSFSKRFSIFFKLLKGNAYRPFELGGLGFKVLLKDFILGLVCGRSFIAGK